MLCVSMMLTKVADLVIYIEKMIYDLILPEILTNFVSETQNRNWLI